MAIVGDVVDTCKRINYENFKKILNEGIDEDSHRIIAMGNREYYLEDISKEDHEERFMEELELESLYYDKWIKGYHFIVLKDFTMINTSSTYYVMSYNDSNEPIYKTQGLSIEVYKYKVIIRRREVLTKKWIGKPYIIEYKNTPYKSVR